MTAIKQLLTPSEAEFQQSIVDLAHATGWHAAHFRPGRTGSGSFATQVAYDGAGFPDLVLCGRGIIFAEIKSQKGRLQPAQEEWAGRLCAAGATWYVWRPSDWDAIQAVLTQGVKR